MSILIMKKTLYRSEKDKILAGVAGGLAEYFEVDANLIRFIFILLTLLGGSGILMYIILWILLPSQAKAGEPSVGKIENSTSQQWFAILIILLGVFFSS